MSNTRGYGSIHDATEIDGDIDNNAEARNLDGEHFPVLVTPRQICWVALTFAALTLLWGRPFSPTNNLQISQALLGNAKRRHQTKRSHKNHDPAKALYFDQIVDHNHPDTSGTFPQRYYENLRYWEGPGHPIFMIFGGEGPLLKILYPFISEILAARFGAYTINPEHRYFGKSFPVEDYSKKDIREQLTPRQAIQDFMLLAQAKQRELGCGPRGTAEYCPVMTVGASYAGLLSTLSRVAYPDIVDIGYAGGPCLKLFDHSADPNTYYDYITEVAERMSPGCPSAVHSALAQVREDLDQREKHHNLKEMAKEYGICADDEFKRSIKNGADLADEIIEYNSAHFADTSMDNYPPGPQTKFLKACEIFEDKSRSTQQKVKDFYKLMDAHATKDQCHQLGADDETDLWDALCCQIMPMIGKSNHTMWFPRPYNLKADVENCKKNFGITVDINATVREFGFNDLSQQTRLLLTNGFNDGWYPLSYTEPPGDGVVVMNFENGAHHSELTHELQPDTPDIAQGHQEIGDLVERWLG